MNWLCRIGLHAWKTEPLVASEDVVFLHFDGEVCQRCEKLHDPQKAFEALAMMKKHLKTKNARFKIHPALARQRAK